MVFSGRSTRSTRRDLIEVRFFPAPLVGALPEPPSELTITNSQPLLKTKRLRIINRKLLLYYTNVEDTMYNVILINKEHNAAVRRIKLKLNKL